MIKVAILSLAGVFAENKDVARDIRLGTLESAIARKEEITLDFQGVEGATQSFMHALISDIIRRHGGGVLDTIYFKNCNPIVQKIIGIVTDYVQEAE